MFSRSFIALSCLSLSLLVPGAAEDNAWPFFVKRGNPSAQATQAEYIGPLLFAHANGGTSHGFRPLFMTSHTGDVTEGNFLYPFFSWRHEPGYRDFSFFQLVNFRSDAATAAAPDDHFDVWPLYFSRTSARDPAASYRAFFPVGGTIKNRFGKDRIDFVLFPLYARTEKNDKRTTHTPWPLIRSIGGGDYHGFELWPLFGRQGRPGDYDRQFYLWPLLYKSVTQLDQPVPTVSVGALPFYARDTGPGYISETYAWPFFGYTHRVAPYHYDEQRYFWPLLVQGRGDQRTVNRWAPVYTHSNIKGYDKTWFLWPVYRRARWDDADQGLSQEKKQFLFFIYWSLEQHSRTNPAAAAAHKAPLVAFVQFLGQRCRAAPSAGAQSFRGFLSQQFDGPPIVDATVRALPLRPPAGVGRAPFSPVERDHLSAYSR